GATHAAILADHDPVEAILEDHELGRLPRERKFAAVVRPVPKVLVIDDDIELRLLLEAILTSRGYIVRLAADGEQGFAAAEREVPDVIVSDILMPKMDGWTLLRRLRSSSRYALVPFVFLTVLGETESRARGFHLGA